MPAAQKEHVDYAAKFDSSSVAGGLDLAEPLVPGCHKCGAKPERVKGVLTFELDEKLRPVCKGCK